MKEIDDLIGACTFHEPKAKQIHDIAKQVVAGYGGELPCDLDVLLSFRGVGPKCAIWPWASLAASHTSALIFTFIA